MPDTTEAQTDALKALDDLENLTYSADACYKSIGQTYFRQPMTAKASTANSREAAFAHEHFAVGSHLSQGEDPFFAPLHDAIQAIGKCSASLYYAADREELERIYAIMNQIRESFLQFNWHLASLMDAMKHISCKKEKGRVERYGFDRSGLPHPLIMAQTIQRRRWEKKMGHDVDT